MFRENILSYSILDPAYLSEDSDRGGDEDFGLEVNIGDDNNIHLFCETFLVVLVC